MNGAIPCEDRAGILWRGPIWGWRSPLRSLREAESSLRRIAAGRSLCRSSEKRFAIIRTKAAETRMRTALQEDSEGRGSDRYRASQTTVLPGTGPHLGEGGRRLDSLPDLAPARTAFVCGLQGLGSARSPRRSRALPSGRRAVWQSARVVALSEPWPCSEAACSARRAGLGGPWDELPAAASVRGGCGGGVG